MRLHCLTDFLQQYHTPHFLPNLHVPGAIPVPQKVYQDTRQPFQPTPPLVFAPRGVTGIPLVDAMNNNTLAMTDANADLSGIFRTTRIAVRILVRDTFWVTPLSPSLTMG
jgi:hypothetical protein